MTARKRAAVPAPVATPAAPAALPLPNVPAIVQAALPFLDHGYSVEYSGPTAVMLARRSTPVGRFLYWLASVLVLTGSTPGAALVPVGVARSLHLGEVGALMLRYGVARKPNVYLALDDHGALYAA